MTKPCKILPRYTTKRIGTDHFLFARSNEVQEHVNKDDSADIPFFIQYDRKYMNKSTKIITLANLL